MRNIDLFDNYLYNRQNTEDRKLFDERLISDGAFKQEFDEHTAFVKLLREYGKQQELKKQLDEVYTEEFGKPNMVSIKPNTFYNRHGKTIGMAASVAVIVLSLSTTLGWTIAEKPLKPFFVNVTSVVLESWVTDVSVAVNTKSCNCGLNWITNSGGVLSMVKPMVCSCSLFPALSVEKKLKLCWPSAVTVIGLDVL